VSFSYQIAKKASKLAFSKKAEDILIIEIKDLTSISDYFVICTANSAIHAKTIYETILDGFISEEKPYRTEGLNNSSWIIMDYVNVVIHIFQEKERNYYSIERLWDDGNFEKFKNVE
tara:strand:- start:6664 stop:7014 length:351 start_codon:yes stop_codon:yes gene_type:complete